jgi:aminoglycoside phosphotransferase (APT) family kinase protein
MRRVEGDVPQDVPSYHTDGWMPQLSPDRQRRVWESGLDAMAAIHRLDREGVGLGWVEVVTPARRLELDVDYRHFACGDVPFTAVDRAFEHLRATVPPPTDRPAVCWGDARLGNLIFDGEQRVAAVLDWEMLTAGDPVQDLAWFLVLDQELSFAFDAPRLGALPGRDESVARWEAASGHSAEHLEWYELLTATRYASITVRVMDLLAGVGVLPAPPDDPFDQASTRLLERMLDERS